MYSLLDLDDMEPTASEIQNNHMHSLNIYIFSSQYFQILSIDVITKN